MKRVNVTAYLVPSTDAHQSEYLAPEDRRRQYISGKSLPPEDRRRQYISGRLAPEDRRRQYISGQSTLHMRTGGDSTYQVRASHLRTGGDS